jgi:hypothetical protein
MAQSEPGPVTGTRDAAECTPGQEAREAALREVAETLRNIEQAIRRAHRAEQAVAAAVHEPALEKALKTATEQLQAARRELVQSAYFGTSDLRLF